VAAEWTVVVSSPSCSAVNERIGVFDAWIAEKAGVVDAAAGAASAAAAADADADAAGAAGETKEFQEQLPCFGGEEEPGDAEDIAMFAASGTGCHSTQAGSIWAGKRTSVGRGCHAVAN
jgi:hypothetical protein